jgi:hypothetical protein
VLLLGDVPQRHLGGFQRPAAAPAKRRCAAAVAPRARLARRAAAHATPRACSGQRRPLLVSTITGAAGAPGRGPTPPPPPRPARRPSVRCRPARRRCWRSAASRSCPSSAAPRRTPRPWAPRPPVRAARRAAWDPIWSCAPAAGRTAAPRRPSRPGADPPPPPPPHPLSSPLPGSTYFDALQQDASFITTTNDPAGFTIIDTLAWGALGRECRARRGAGGWLACARLCCSLRARGIALLDLGFRAFALTHRTPCTRHARRRSGLRLPGRHLQWRDPR